MFCLKKTLSHDFVKYLKTIPLSLFLFRNKANQIERTMKTVCYFCHGQHKTKADCAFDTEWDTSKENNYSSRANSEIFRVDFVLNNLELVFSVERKDSVQQVLVLNGGQMCI